jgi:hypothetical protein
LEDVTRSVDSYPGCWEYLAARDEPSALDDVSHVHTSVSPVRIGLRGSNAVKRYTDCDGFITRSLLMQGFPHRYSVTAVAVPEGDAFLEAERLPVLVSAPPTEFGVPAIVGRPRLCWRRPWRIVPC